MMISFFKIFGGSTMIVATLLLASCSGTERISGNLPSPQKFEQVEVGISSKQDIQRLFGTPSITPLFDDQHWYYSRKITDTLAFYTSDIQNKVLSVSFDDQGIVQDIALLGENDMYAIEHAARITPSEGIKTTIWQQIFKSYGSLPSSGTSPGGI